MTTNVLQMVDAFRTDDLNDVQAKRTQQALQQVQAGETMLKLRNQNVLRDVSRGQSDLSAVADAYQQQTGDVMGAQALRSQQRQNVMGEWDAHLKALDMLSKSSKMVTSENYGSWRQSMVGMGLAGADDLPDAYDQALIDRLSGAASAELKKLTINNPDGTAVDVFTRGGREVERTKPYPRWQPKEAKDYETWSEPYEEGGRRYQKSTRGKIRTVDPQEPRDTEADTKHRLAIEHLMLQGATRGQAQEIADGMRAGLYRDNGFGGLVRPDGTEVPMPWLSGAAPEPAPEKGGVLPNTKGKPKGFIPVESRKIGAVYDTPRGKMKWMGTGWQPVK